MPFPWKKAKNTRISQLVNDHLQNSKKRPGGSSLMVETGFPTSLVDFAVKNGDKLRKPSKKNRAKPSKIPPENENNDPVILQSSSILSSPSFTTPSSSRCSSSSCNPLPPGTMNLDEVSVGANASGVGRQVLVSVVKLILVVVLVLVLGTKKLVVGITISAFLLIFLEYVSKYTCGMLKPCSDAQKGLRLTVQRVFRCKEDNSDQKNFDPGCSDFDNCESMRPFQESRVIEQYCGEVIPREKEIMDEHICKEIDSEKVVNDVEESICEVLELKRRMSRKDKIKSKMKKLVPKKLRSSKKEENNSRSSKIYSFPCEEDESEDDKNQKL